MVTTPLLEIHLPSLTPKTKQLLRLGLGEPQATADGFGNLGGNQLHLLKPESDATEIWKPEILGLLGGQPVESLQNRPSIGTESLEKKHVLA